MINRRGIVAVLISATASLAIGWNAGSFRQDLMWRADWTRLSSTGMLCKGDRLK